MDFLFYLAAIPALGVAAQWLAWRTKLPSILVLLLFGIGLGLYRRPDAFIAELTGGRDEAISAILFPLVSLAVAVIMFEGGLSLKLSDLKESGGAALRLCTIGAAITFFGAAVAAHYCFDHSWTFCFLLGAILTVTGPTVVGPLLRQVRPSRRVANTLKWEGIVIDPIGAILAVLVFEQLVMHHGDPSILSAVLMLLKTAAIGGGLGVAGGIAIAQSLRRFWLPDHLHGVAALSLGVLLFAIANEYAHESGLITVTVMGIWLTNQRSLDVEEIIEFKENLRTLLLGCLFIVLGSRVDLFELRSVLVPSLVFLALLILIVRPLATFVSLIGSSLKLNEQAFVASLAPRGIVAAAVSSVFALELEHSAAGSAMDAGQLSTITFVIIVGTVAIYGLLATPMAKLLRLADGRDDGVLIIGADPFVIDFAHRLHEAGVPVHLVDTNYNKVAQAKQMGLDGSCINMLNEHAREELVLRGVGNLLAMTPNDEVNSLILKECRSMFDRSSMYQLAFNPEKLKSKRGLTTDLMGRVLFGDSMTHSHLKQSHEVGATFKLTPLSESFTFEHFTTKNAGGYTLLGVIDEDDQLVLNTSEAPIVPTPGQSVLSLVTSVAVPQGHAAKPKEPVATAGSV